MIRSLEELVEEKLIRSDFTRIGRDRAKELLTHHFFETGGDEMLLTDDMAFLLTALAPERFRSYENAVAYLMKLKDDGIVTPTPIAPTPEGLQ